MRRLAPLLLVMVMVLSLLCACSNPGGAWYPGPTEMWDNNSRVVSNGNYVMMVIHENCDEIVSQFNELF